jgi:anthranilate synthase/aminodeoxychorismate synthase-like glutamine amidotransferase
VILIIDNYDSFTYNLVQAIGGLDASREMTVVRNDASTIDELEALEPECIIISPGPGTPREAGVSVNLVKRFFDRVPILGVCLGHQCIGQAFGARTVRAPRLMHGKTSSIRHDGQGLFRNVSNPFTATRYHSLTLDRESLPDELVETAWTVDRDELMGLRHAALPVEGVQFHPESFLTAEGPRLIENFLRR